MTLRSTGENMQKLAKRGQVLLSLSPFLLSIARQCFVWTWQVDNCYYNSWHNVAKHQQKDVVVVTFVLNCCCYIKHQTTILTNTIVGGV